MDDRYAIGTFAPIAIDLAILVSTKQDKETKRPRENTVQKPNNDQFEFAKKQQTN
jgi:hypothetical protein